MNVCVKQWMRSWVMGTATMGLLSPGMLVAQTVQPSSKPTDHRIATEPAQLKRDPQAVRLAAHESNESVPQLAESEVEARLRELYERDGREMPNMTLTPSSAQAQTTAPQGAPAGQPRYSSAPAIAPAPKPQNRVTGFFKKLLPGGSRKSPTQATNHPPRQLQPAYSSPPVVTSVPPVAQPRNVAQPRPITQPQGVSASQLTGQYQQPSQSSANFGQTTPNVTIPSQPAARPIAVARPSAAPATRSADLGAVYQTTAPRATPRINESQIPAVNPSQNAVPQIGEPEISYDADETDVDSMELDDLEVEQAPQLTTPSVAAPSSGFDEDFPDPFAGATADESPSEAIENPYTGQTLEPLEAQPAPRMPVIAPQGRVDRTATDETTATKMRRIMQRTDMKGLKGFCPVTLRDQRELADSRPDHVATYRGQKFYCASKIAQAKFEADPARYAPAAYGADVVVLTDDQDVAEGTLDYAAWYKGRLYLFSSQETHDTFVANPERYASPPGIE